MEPDPTPLAGRMALGLAAALWAALVPGGLDVVMARPLCWPRLVPERAPLAAEQFELA